MILWTCRWSRSFLLKDDDQFRISFRLRRLAEKKPDELPLLTVPYYQMWPHEGFKPDLSVLDLMMNMGREGIFTLMAMGQPKEP